jgi:hypothetical protein
MAMDPRDRVSELLFAEVMRRAAPVLVAHPFTDAGWDARALSHLKEAGASLPSPAQQTTAGAPTPRSATPVMASVYADGARGRLDLLAAVLGEADNPAWSVLDRTAALDALARYADLNNRGRYELFGAATAATWLAGRAPAPPLV